MAKPAPKVPRLPAPEVKAPIMNFANTLVSSASETLSEVLTNVTKRMTKRIDLATQFVQVVRSKFTTIRAEIIQVSPSGHLHYTWYGRVYKKGIHY